jgi:hypothetical protein
VVGSPARPRSEGKRPITAETREPFARNSVDELRGARVSLITYDVPHKKTQDILFRLLPQGRFEITLTLVPFTSRPQRMTAFQHRPAQLVGPDPTTLAKEYKLETFAVENWR